MSKRRKPSHEGRGEERKGNEFVCIFGSDLQTMSTDQPFAAQLLTPRLPELMRKREGGGRKEKRKRLLRLLVSYSPQTTNSAATVLPVRLYSRGDGRGKREGKNVLGKEGREKGGGEKKRNKRRSSPSSIPTLLNLSRNWKATVKVRERRGKKEPEQPFSSYSKLRPISHSRSSPGVGGGGGKKHGWGERKKKKEGKTQCPSSSQTICNIVVAELISGKPDAKKPVLEKGRNQEKKRRGRKGWPWKSLSAAKLCRVAKRKKGGEGTNQNASLVISLSLSGGCWMRKKRKQEGGRGEKESPPTSFKFSMGLFETHRGGRT